MFTAILAVDEPFLKLDQRADDCWWGPIRDRPFIDAYRSDYEFVHPFKMKNLTNHLEILKSPNDANLIIADGSDDTCVFCNLLLLHQSIKLH